MRRSDSNPGLPDGRPRCEPDNHAHSGHLICMLMLYYSRQAEFDSNSCQFTNFLKCVIELWPDVQLREMFACAQPHLNNFYAGTCALTSSFLKIALALSSIKYIHGTSFQTQSFSSIQLSYICNELEKNILNLNSSLTLFQLLAMILLFMCIVRA